MNNRLILAITIAVVSVLAGASSQLDPILGATASKAVTSLCSLVGAVLASVMGVLSTQTSQVQAVQDMPGISKVLVNAQASPALAQVASSDAAPKVMAEPGAERKVAEIANQ